MSSHARRMTEGPIWKHIVVFALPVFLGSLFQQMYNVVDSLVVGNFLGSEALAAVGSSSSLIFLLTGAEVYIVDYLLLHGRRFSSLRQEGILCDRDFPAGASERRRWMDSLDSDGPDYQDGFFRLKALDEGGAAR